MIKMHFKTSVFMLMLLCLAVFSACSNGGGGGKGGDKPDLQAPSVGTAPKVSWTVEYDVKNPVTDLAGCAESVLDCIKGGTPLNACFDSEVSICAGDEPINDCCMQACADQLLQKLEGGTDAQDAYLEVFVYDGTCMPNIPEAAKQ